jgi:hypothetical protein
MLAYLNKAKALVQSNWKPVSVGYALAYVVPFVLKHVL